VVHGSRCCYPGNGIERDIYARWLTSLWKANSVRSGLGAPEEARRSPGSNSLRSTGVASWIKESNSSSRRLQERSECNRWKAEVQNGAFFGRGRCNARHFLPPADLLVCGHPWVSSWQVRNPCRQVQPKLAPCQAMSRRAS
jgi:hypothetical protein